MNLIGTYWHVFVHSICICSTKNIHAISSWQLFGFPICMRVNNCEVSEIMEVMEVMLVRK